jgi:hypothetical protein
MRNEHKKPVAGTAGVGRKSHVLRGEELGRRRPQEGRAGRSSFTVLDLVVAFPPAHLKLGRSWEC